MKIEINFTKIYESIICKLFDKILNKNGGKVEYQGHIIVRQLLEFHQWCYNNGYLLWKKEVRIIKCLEN